MAMTTAHNLNLRLKAQVSTAVEQVVGQIATLMDNSKDPMVDAPLPGLLMTTTPMVTACTRAMLISNPMMPQLPLHRTQAEPTSGETQQTQVARTARMTGSTRLPNQRQVRTMASKALGTKDQSSKMNITARRCTDNLDMEICTKATPPVPPTREILCHLPHPHMCFQCNLHRGHPSNSVARPMALHTPAPALVRRVDYKHLKSAKAG